MKQKKHSVLEPRLMRVFVSSTFRDMQAERDELVKHVFPQLRKMCEQRGVTWGEVDLRWGVTDEQKAEGRVLPICLEEIRRCRPYFIGLLGERYGWVPDSIPEELVEREPWLAGLQDHSVTELEILHGVLNDPEMSEHAYFYFRDPCYADRLPLSEQADFRDVPSAEEMERLGPEKAQEIIKAHREKQAGLKNRIRAGGFPVRENYSDPVELGRLVLDDFTKLIERFYPAQMPPDPLARENADHEAFAASRRKVYIGRQAYFACLDEHVNGTTPPLVVLGESGSGKSALLANWAARYRAEHPDELVLLHFIGATPAGADWAVMLSRLMAALKNQFGFTEAIPTQADALRQAFTSWLSLAAARGKAVLVLDALNQLEDRDGAPDLTWLPETIPGNIRLVLSTLPGRALDELTRRGWPVLKVEPLQKAERQQLAEASLALYSKTLGAANLRQIVDAPQTANPLYLSIILDELRLFGRHEKLGERIRYYLEAAEPMQLYQKVLARCEQDYERERPCLVREAMALLWAARHGLSEAELLDLLGTESGPLPGAFWSPLSLALEGGLLDRAGSVGFSHAFLRQAVESRYLAEPESKRKTHIKIATYFKERDNEGRKIEELPWQWAQSQSWQELYDLLIDIPFFRAAWKVNELALNAYWAQLEGQSNLRLAEAYKEITAAPEKYEFDCVRWIAIMLETSGSLERASQVFESLVNLCRRNEDDRHLATALGDQAHIRMMLGIREGVFDLYKEKERLCWKSGDKEGLAIAFSGQGHLLFEENDFEGSMALYKESEKLCREMGQMSGVQAALANQAKILMNEDEPNEALRLLAEQERICREHGILEGMAGSFGMQASIYAGQGDYEKAMTLYTREEQIFRQQGNKLMLAISLANHAQTLGITLGEPKKAARMVDEAMQLAVECGNENIIQRIQFIHYQIFESLVVPSQSQDVPWAGSGMRPGWVSALSISLCLAGLALFILDLTMPLLPGLKAFYTKSFDKMGMGTSLIVLPAVYCVLTGVGLMLMKRWGILLCALLPIAMSLYGGLSIYSMLSRNLPLSFLNVFVAILLLGLGLPWSIGLWRLWKRIV